MQHIRRTQIMSWFKETEGVATTLSLGRREISHQRGRARRQQRRDGPGLQVALQVAPLQFSDQLFDGSFIPLVRHQGRSGSVDDDQILHANHRDQMV